MKKIGLLCLALVLALGTLGIAYAAWIDTITIEGQVTTGSLCWKFASCTLLDDVVFGGKPTNYGGDYPTAVPDRTCNPGFVPGPNDMDFWPLDKNVGWGEQLISADGKTLYVTLNNVYPCYFNAMSFYVRNCGTVPLKVDHIVINGQIYTSGVPYVQFDFNDDGFADFEIQWGNNWGEQIDPGARSPEFSFWMHVLQPCPQSQLNTLTFNITLVAVQWNEYPLWID
jgi:hypothetical protein